MAESYPTPDPGLLSINTATVRQQWRLPDIISGCAALGIRGISPWRDQVAEAGLKETAQRIRDAGLFVSGYCRGGMFPAIDGAGRRAARDDNRRAVDEALTVGARCLVLVVGIGDLLEYSRSAGMPLAIEPLHPMYAADRACVNTMSQANDLCDELGDDGLGIAVDVYHVWWDPQLRAQIERAGDKRLLAFHFCDWLVPTRDLLLDRGMMGDGVIDLPLIRSWMERAGYRGAHEVEIFSANDWWKRDPVEVLRTCVHRHQTVC